MDYYKLEKEINQLWKKGILKDGSHIFFKDIKEVEKRVNMVREDFAKQFDLKSIPTSIQTCASLLLKNYPKIKEIKDEKPEWEKPLTENEIFDFISYLNNKQPDSSLIYQKIEDIKNRILPSNIELKKHLAQLQKTKNENRKRFLIMGAGPNGLFIAILLNHIYNKIQNGITQSENIDILIIDNRIAKEGFRQPYTRNRRFSYSDISLTYLYKYLYCNNTYAGGPINFIEYLGYLKVMEENIPIYFTKKYETNQEIKNLIDENQFDVLFDCSGGRLDIKEIKSNINYSLSNKLPIKQDGFILERDDNQIIFKPENENNPYIKMFYLEMFNSNKESTNQYIDLFTLYTCDIGLYSHYENQLLTINNLESIISLVKDPLDATYLKYKLSRNPSFVKYFKFVPIPVNMHHLIKIADVMKTKKDKDFLYVASGDTLFHSHFVTGAGINRLFNFIVRVLYKF